MLNTLKATVPLTAGVFVVSALSDSLVNRWAFGRMSSYHMASMFSAAVTGAVFFAWRYSHVRRVGKADLTFKVCNTAAHRVMQRLQVIMCLADQCQDQCADPTPAKKIKDEVRQVAVLVNEPLVAVAENIMEKSAPEQMKALKARA